MTKLEKACLFVKKVGFGVTALVLFLCMILGTGQVDASGVQSKPEKQAQVLNQYSSNKQDGFTFYVKNANHDSKILTFKLERKGGTKSSPTMIERESPDGKTKYSQKGVLEHLELFVNGKRHKFTRKSMKRGEDSNSFIFEYRADKPLPDKFDLMIKLKVSKVKNPYMIKIPMKSKGRTILKPDMIKAYKNFQFILERVELSSLTTTIDLVGYGDIKDLPLPSVGDRDEYFAEIDSLIDMGFDIIDEQGNHLKNNGIYYGLGKGTGTYKLKLNFSPFKSLPKTITIMPYVENMESTTGKPEKIYIQELQFEVPVN
ncbi:DUF5643 domain-containing protein [Paenibacillus sp. SC116]|uniref:DUF5643 domain-containing protein n=1 Tax=Paenibacillus sp. SC116 TaxID=2968986 RepID=UPI00215A6134|nr:DUF5643 domain-containing protein [Paenibacillus sp. SC116]MCR8842214.1 DUF5643 domain-containing protein [Paenibacillus sp. SC116]